MTVKLNYPMYTLLERASYIRVYLKMEGYHLVGGTNNSGSQKVVFISAKWQLCICRFTYKNKFIRTLYKIT